MSTNGQGIYGGYWLFYKKKNPKYVANLLQSLEENEKWVIMNIMGCGYELCFYYFKYE